VRHSSFSPEAVAALSTMDATSMVCAGAAVAADDAVAEDDPVLAAAPPPADGALAGVALALLPRIALMIFPKILIVCSL
jgi:hypothetical protein